MPNPLFDDMATTVESSPGGGGGPEPKAGATALLPRTFFRGDPPKPGDTVTFRVSRVFQDEVSVEPVGAEAPEPEDESEAEEPGEGAAEDQGLYL